jgi:ParB family chromosome partitioning protein
LSALIPGAEQEHVLVDVPIDTVEPNPRQPRTGFPAASLTTLAGSITEVGVLQPIIVRSVGGRYELVAGERRLRAAKLAGLTVIPALIRETGNDDSLREALIENIHREDLNPLELAAAFQQLVEDLGATHETVADRLGYSRAHVANTIRLLTLPPDVQRLLAEGRIQAGHARALLALPDDEARSALALRIAAEGSSVREVERLVKTYAASGRRTTTRARARGQGMAPIEELLSERLATRVQVSMGRGKGRIVVEFGSREDLDRLVDAMSGVSGASARTRAVGGPSERAPAPAAPGEAAPATS